MKKETFVILKEADLTSCIAWMREHLSLHGIIEVEVSDKTKSRSGNQLRLLWLWNTEIADHMGLSKDEIHEMLKRQYAVPIFTRDDADYANMVTTVKGIRKMGMADKAEALAQKISKLTSTTDFTVDQMSEYLQDMEHYAAEKGVALTFPVDLYEDSKGVKGGLDKGDKKAAPAASQAPQAGKTETAVKPKEKTKDFKFLKVMSEQKKRVGDAAYYEAIKAFGVEHADEITVQAKKVEAFRALDKLPPVGLGCTSDPNSCPLSKFDENVKPLCFEEEGKSKKCHFG